MIESYQKFVFLLGDPDDLVSAVKGKPIVHSIANWRELSQLSLLNLTYDVTPGDLVTAVITELAVLPCTSVPVVLRVKHAEIAIWKLIFFIIYRKIHWWFNSNLQVLVHLYNTCIPFLYITLYQSQESKPILITFLLADFVFHQW